MPNALPVFSVDTVKQAKGIMVRYCRLQYDGRMTWTDFSGNVDDLEQVAIRMQSFLNGHAG